MNALLNQYSLDPGGDLTTTVTETAIDWAALLAYRQAPSAVHIPWTSGPSPLGYNASLTSATAHRASPKGVVEAVLAVLSRWDISTASGCVILGCPERDVLLPMRPIAPSLSTRDMRDRAKLLLDIYEGVFGLLQDPQGERDWIRAPRPEFEGQSVLDLMTEGSQRNLIRAVSFVDYVNGR